EMKELNGQAAGAGVAVGASRGAGVEAEGHRQDLSFSPSGRAQVVSTITSSPVSLMILRCTESLGRSRSRHRFPLRPTSVLPLPKLRVPRLEIIATPAGLTGRFGALLNRWVALHCRGP